MSKFCLGTLFTIIKKCVDESFVQHRDIREVFETLSQSYSPEPDMIVHIVGGRKNPAKSFIDEINSYDSSVYGEFSECMESVTNHIDPNKVDLLVKMLTTTIKGDEAIQDTTIVDLINGTRKKDLPGQYGNISSFLAGLFIYAVKYTNNKGSVLSVKAINDQFVAEHMGYVSTSPTIKKSSVEVSELEICEEDELKAKRFLIDHENEKELIPLCQIAMIHS
ncbi:MAG: hypothetical protein II167_01360, partial [Clostridiales bacterium]|nr:hypothetical protein [Clostridiales bacterium]